MPKVVSYGLVDGRPAGGTLALVRLISRGKEILTVTPVGVYENIIDAVDAFYNHGWARWYVKEPLPEAEDDQ